MERTDYLLTDDQTQCKRAAHLERATGKETDERFHERMHILDTELSRLLKDFATDVFQTCSTMLRSLCQ